MKINRYILNHIYKTPLIFLPTIILALSPQVCLSASITEKITNLYYLPTPMGNFCVLQLQKNSNHSIRWSYALTGKKFTYWRDVIGEVKSADTINEEMILLFEGGLIFKYSTTSSYQLPMLKSATPQRIYTDKSNKIIYITAQQPLPENPLIPFQWKIYKLYNNKWNKLPELPSATNDPANIAEPHLLISRDTIFLFIRTPQTIQSWKLSNNTWQPQKALQIPTTIEEFIPFQITTTKLLILIDSNHRVFLTNLLKPRIIPLKVQSRDFVLPQIHSTAKEANKILFALFNPKDSTITLHRFLPTGTYQGKPEKLTISFKTELPEQPSWLFILLLLLAIILAIFSRTAPLPQPSQAETQKFSLAPLWRRSLAFIIDFFPISFIISLIFYDKFAHLHAESDFFRSLELIQTDPFMYYLAIGTSAIYALYCCICEAWFGKTIGKHTLNMEVRQALDPTKKITLAQSAIRNFTKIVELYFPILLVVLLITRNRQRIGDIIARTIVIYTSPNT